MRWVVLLALVLAAGCERCRDEAPAPIPSSAQPEPLCQGVQRAVPARADRIVELLRSTDRGGRLLERASAPVEICFAEIAVASVTTDGLFLLDPRISEAESAARLGHLLLHRIEGGVLRVGEADERPCDVVVDEALRAEARAHALELELRRALGVERPTHELPFAQLFWDAPDGERVEALYRFFQDHPEGGDGIPGFVRAYAARCDRRDRPPALDSAPEK